MNGLPNDAVSIKNAIMFTNNKKILIIYKSIITRKSMN